MELGVGARRVEGGVSWVLGPRAGGACERPPRRGQGRAGPRAAAAVRGAGAAAAEQTKTGGGGAGEAGGAAGFSCRGRCLPRPRVGDTAPPHPREPPACPFVRSAEGERPPPHSPRVNPTPPRCAPRNGVLVGRAPPSSPLSLLWGKGSVPEEA